MTKLVYFLKRRPDITPQQFRTHYETSHVRLAQKYIGHLLQSYTRHYPVMAIRNPSAVTPGSTPAPYDIGYDCITEMVVADGAAVVEMGRIFNDPEINPILVEDELQFLDREQTVMITVESVDTGTALS